MPILINCGSYDHRNGACNHQAAPRSLFGRPGCLLLSRHPDPRVPQGCALQHLAQGRAFKTIRIFNEA